MKINIKRLNKWFEECESGEETKYFQYEMVCDRCKQPFNNCYPRSKLRHPVLTDEKPNKNKLDFCVDCCVWLMKNKTTEKEAESMFGKSN